MQQYLEKIESWHLIGAFTASWFVLAPIWMWLFWWICTIALITHIGGWLYRKQNRRQVTGKTVLITGGAMGLGKAMAKRFAQNGNRIVLWDINQEKLKETQQELKKEFPSVKCDVFTVNVTSETDVADAAKQVLDTVEYVDVVVLNAGVVSGFPLLELPMDKMRRVFEVNVFHLFYTSKPFLAKMATNQDRGGHFVVIASIAGYHGINRLSDYCASKAAALSFGESLQEELRGFKNISKTVVCPYFINTGMFEGTRPVTFFKFLEEKDVAKSIYDAVCLKKELLVLPWIMHAVYLVKGLLPAFLTPYIDVLLGTSKTMETFHGRRV